MQIKRVKAHEVDLHRWLQLRPLQDVPDSLVIESMNFETRLATPDERDALYAVYTSMMKSHIAKIWGWDDAWQQTDFDTHFDPSAIQVAIVGDRIVAYIQTKLRHDTPHVRMIYLLQPKS